MATGRIRHECMAAFALPRLVPMPKCYRRAAARLSPWIAVDPVLMADCVGICRRVQLAIVAALALFSPNRTALATESANFAAPGEVRTTSQNDGHPLTAHVDALIAESRPIAYKRMPSGNTTRFVMVESFSPKTPQINMERAHGPPAISEPMALSSISRLIAIPPCIASSSLHSVVPASGPTLLASSHLTTPSLSAPHCCPPVPEDSSRQTGMTGGDVSARPRPISHELPFDLNHFNQPLFPSVCRSLFGRQEVAAFRPTSRYGGITYVCS